MPFLQGSEKYFKKTFPIETDVKMLYPIVVPHNPWNHEVNRTDSTLYQETFI
jgi:hypothetical protein